MFTSRRRVRRRRRLLILILVVGFMLLIFNQFLLKGLSKGGLLISSVTRQEKASSLKQVIEELLSGTTGTYGIVIKNLKTGEQFNLNEQKSFQAGSLYKLWVMVTAYQQIRDGKLKEDEILSGDIKTLNSKFNIASDEAELAEGVITSSVSNALKKMITISHNYDALLLVDRIGLLNIRTFLDQSDFNQSGLGTDDEEPSTTAADIAAFFEELYQGKFVDEESTEKMLELLKSQELNDKVPKYLPKDITVAHKTGELNSFSHDAGIVYTPFGDYIIVVLSDSDRPDAAIDRIAKISQAVYQYFSDTH